MHTQNAMKTNAPSEGCFGIQCLESNFTNAHEAQNTNVVSQSKANDTQNKLKRTVHTVILQLLSQRRRNRARRAACGPALVTSTSCAAATDRRTVTRAPCRCRLVSEYTLIDSVTRGTGPSQQPLKSLQHKDMRKKFLKMGEAHMQKVSKDGGGVIFHAHPTSIPLQTAQERDGGVQGAVH